MPAARCAGAGTIAGATGGEQRFPPIAQHMIAIGERSGELEAMLENVADAYDDQVNAQVQTMASLPSRS